MTNTTYTDTTATPGTTYYYWVVAANSAGNSDFSSPGAAGVAQAATAAPAAPTNVQASNDLTDQVTVTWDASANAVSYQVWSSTTDDSSTANQLATGVTNTTYTDTTATPGTTYYYWVVAANDAGNSDFSSPGAAGAAQPSQTGPLVIQEVEPNDSYTNPQDLGTITTQTDVDGSLATLKDVDWYKFTLPTTGAGGSQIQLTFTGSAGNMSVLFYTDPFTKGPALYGTQAPGSDTISLDGAAAGTYYLRVYGYIAGNYTLAIIRTSPARPRIRRPTCRPAAIRSTRSPSPGTPRRALVLPGLAEHDERLHHGHAAGRQRDRHDLQRHDRPNGHYLLLLGQSGQCRRDQRLQRTSAAGSLGTGGGTISEVEPNNSYTDPQNLGTVDRQINLTGSLATANDVDWYTFTLDSAAGSARGCN